MSIRSRRLDTIQLFGMFQRPVSDKTFQLTDSDRFTFHTQHARALTLRLLRTHPSTNRRQRTIFSNNSGSGSQISRSKLCNKFWDLHRDRAMLHATRFAAMQTTRSLQLRLFKGVTLTHLFKIGNPYFRVLFPHGNSSYLVCHLFPDYLSKPMLQTCPAARSSAT